jgi:hypothetical protein
MTEPQASCSACGTWICDDCGARRARASRFARQPHHCGKCSSTAGHMIEITHRVGRAGDHEASYREAIADGRLVRYPVSSSLADPVSGRREAMIDHLGSWDLEGAMPTGFGLEVVNQYVAGETDLDSAIERLKEHDRNGGYSGRE